MGGEKASPQNAMAREEAAIPRLGYLLRALIKVSGYRRYFVELGLDKSLDDLAAEARDRQSSSFEILQGIEDACSKALASDCGNEWAQLFRQAWFRTRAAIQAFVQQVDITPMPQEKVDELLVQHFVSPMLSGFMHLSLSLRSGPDVSSWWRCPLRTWLSFAANRTGITEESLLTNLANEANVDQRTIDRWLSGDPVGKVSWPYAPTVAATLGKPVAAPEIHLLAGWLLMACAFQSVPPAIRDAARRDFALRKQQPWTLEMGIGAMNRESDRASDCPERNEVEPLLNELQRLFSTEPREDSALGNKLSLFQKLIERASPAVCASYQYISNWYSARHAALLGDKETALKLYASAVSSAWWRAGPDQHPILEEALLYAVGVGDKDAANAYWDKTFMLGLNQGPKRPLDEQEMRRIAFGFEQRFYPQKAKDRVPPPVEIRGGEDTFSLGRKHLANPNQKTKYAEGRTRRTPLMVAVREGTLDEVKQLIAAGGDPNDFIPESGEGPLSYAMRRASDRKDPIIMDYLLSLDLLPKTVKRSASTKRETPLKMAVEMANARAASRLVELGADVEAACDYLPSALCYAMILLHGSLHRDDQTQEQAYFAGKTHADAYDAKEGAVLDVDLAARRERLRSLANASDHNRQILNAVFDYFIRPPQDHRELIHTLLTCGANANRRYRVEAHHLAEWTPTLFAAQVGDLSVFRMLVEHPGPNRGNPELTLMPPSSLERFDALWVAIDHGRHSIASYLLGREKQHSAAGISIN
ncbi:ankyrin repeat domain-containing protein [Ralstonia thomasii]|nr:ankyrin repeat domain-containing protein [Ralstonia sp. LMG 18095]